MQAYAKFIEDSGWHFRLISPFL